METAFEKAVRLLHETGQPQFIEATPEERYRYLQRRYGKLNERVPGDPGPSILCYLYMRQLLTYEEYQRLLFYARNRRALARRSRR